MIVRKRVIPNRSVGPRFHDWGYNQDRDIFKALNNLAELIGGA
jgi:hypothetical protein